MHIIYAKDDTTLTKSASSKKSDDEDCKLTVETLQDSNLSSKSVQNHA